MRFDLITPVEAAGIKHYLVNERTAGRGKLKPSSANRAISVIKPVFQFAIDYGYLKVFPLVKVNGGKSSSLEALKCLGVDSVTDLQECEKSILDLITKEWFRILESPKIRGHENKAAVHPLWERVRSLFFQY